MGTYFNRF